MLNSVGKHTNDVYSPVKHEFIENHILNKLHNNKEKELPLQTPLAICATFPGVELLVQSLPIREEYHLALYYGVEFITFIFLPSAGY